MVQPEALFGVIAQQLPEELTGLTQISLIAGTAAMFIGMVAFIAMGWGVEDEKKQEYYAITILIPAIAFVSYLTMALGIGETAIQVDIGGADQETLHIFWARYADWLFTTPLLLLDLGLLAGASRVEIGSLIGLDVMMIITGVYGAFTTGQQFLLNDVANRIIWWGVSTAFLLVLLYFLTSRLTAKARQMSGDAASTFMTLRNLVIVLWLAYPVVWILGTEGTLGIVPLGVETALFAVLDVTAKVGFGFILLRSRAVMGGTGTDVGATATADD
jgi:bacteriorhodopsin